MGMGDLVLGLLNGLTIGLLAVGLVLVYKSNKFLNLAHAQLGTLSAVLVAKWVRDWGWNWWVAFAAAILVGAVTGLLVEYAFVAPLRRRTKSPMTLLLLTLGISQLLLALTYVPWLLPKSNAQAAYPQPFESHAHVGGLPLSAVNLLTAVLVPSLVLALALFMRYSSTGKQIRAAANNSDAARLCGISVRRVSAVTWVMAGALSAVSAVLQAPGQATFGLAALGPYLLMLTLGAAAFGAFVSLPWALVGGLVFGLVTELVAAHWHSAQNPEVLASFALILLVVLVRGRAISAAFEVSGSGVDDLPVMKVPQSLRQSPLVRHQRLGLAVAALFLAAIWPQLPYFSGAGNRFILTEILIFAAVGIALTMLMGWGGQVSLGHFAMVGVGAYLTARWATHGWSLPLLCLVIGFIVSAVMVVVGLPALRVRGLTLAVTTLGFAVVAEGWLFRQSWFGSTDPFGLTVSPIPVGRHLGTPRSEVEIYYVAVAVLTVTVLAAGALRRSNPGRL